VVVSRQGHLFEGARLQMTESIELTVASLEAHAAVDCAREPWLIRDLYVATFIDALRERGAAIVA